MTQGKIERNHRSMKNAVNLQNYYSPEDLEREIVQFVDYYNNQRYHESLYNLTPMDVYTGIAKEVLAKRAEIKQRTLQARRLQNLQAQAVEVKWFRVRKLSLSKCQFLSQMFWGRTIYHQIHDDTFEVKD
jgi:hypothetical protein